MQSAEDFDNIYQHQFTFNSNCNADSAANVFTANSEEYLTQISVSTGSAMDYTASVYRLSNNYSSPVDGQLLTKFDGSTDFNGIHTVKLPDPVKLNKGDNFSVVITNHNPEKSFFSIQTKMYLNRTYQRGKCYYYDNTKQGEGWYDCADASSEYGYAEIKAFTQNSMRKADTTELENAVNTAENLVISNVIDETSVNKLNSDLANAKAVLNKTDALQYEVNNAYYCLNTSINKINNYFYYINSEEDFINYYNLNNSENAAEISKNIVFNCDLDFSEYDMEFEPLFKNTTFSGTVEGNNHIIKNIKFKAPEKQETSPVYTGLFGMVEGGSISNLTIDGASVNGTNNCGCTVGMLASGKIYNCHVINSKIRSDGFAATAGGIAGSVANGIVENCSVENSEITSLSYAGGINGNTWFSENIINSTVLGNTVSGLDFVGNISGSSDSDDLFSVNSVSEKQNFKPYITITDDECTVTSFVGTIISLTSDDTDIVKLDDKYTFPLQNSSVELKIYYKEDEPCNVNFDYNLNGDIIIKDYFANSNEVILPETMFASCRNLKQVDLGNNVSVIESWAFMCCGLEEITLQESLIEVQNSIFSTCENLKKVILPESLTKIGDSMFMDCNQLNEVVLGNNLKVIENYAFYNCRSLTNLKIPDSVEIIGKQAFINSPISKIVLGKNIKEIGTSAFGVTNYPNEHYKYVTIPDYVINGYASTAAEQYAKENGFKFVDLYVDEPDISDNIFDYSVFKLGDVNLDGIVSITDVTFIQLYLSGLKGLNDIQKSNALVNIYTENISITNATFIQLYLAGFEPSLYNDSKG